MIGWIVAGAIWLLGFARTACSNPHVPRRRLVLGVLWPLMAVPCLIHLVTRLGSWRRARNAR